MKRAICLIPAILLFVLVGAANAAAVKVGTVDLPHILQQSPQVQAINEKLNKEFRPEQQKIVAAQKNIRSEANKLNPEQAKKLSKEEQKKIQEKLILEQKNLNQMVSKFQQKVRTAQTRAMKQFMSEVNNAVKIVAKKKSLDIVLLKPAVMYAADAQDITSDVLAQLPK